MAYGKLLHEERATHGAHRLSEGTPHAFRNHPSPLVFTHLVASPRLNPFSPLAYLEHPPHGGCTLLPISHRPFALYTQPDSPLDAQLNLSLLLRLFVLGVHILT
jgi:hypothetical protein